MKNQPKEQRNHIQPIPMRNQPKEHTEKSKPTQTHEKSNQRTHREIKTQNTNHNPKLQKSNSTNKSTNPRFMRRKGIEHQKKKNCNYGKPYFLQTHFHNLRNTKQ